MFTIKKKNEISPNVFSLWIEAPRVAKSAKPGQFVIVVADEKGERVPLTIADFDTEKGTVEIVVQALGSSTKKISSFQQGEDIRDFVGPLGNPSEFIYKSEEELKSSSYIFVAGGVGIAPVYPQAKWLYERGAKVDIIVGARSKDYLIFKDKLSSVCDHLYIATDDGSEGFHGLVTDLLKHLVKEKGKKYTHCISIGPLIMMKFVSLLTKEYNLPTTVSLNPIMVDGTGMCGACRCTVDGKTRFACVEGPEFDAHLVDFDEALLRQKQYVTIEKEKDDCLLEGELLNGPL